MYFCINVVTYIENQIVYDAFNFPHFVNRCSFKYAAEIRWLGQVISQNRMDLLDQAMTTLHLMGMKSIKHRCAHAQEVFMFFLYITDFVFHFLFIYVVSIFQPRSSAPITGYKRMRTKAVAARGKRPNDIISNENSNESQAADAGNKNVECADVDQPPKAKRQKTGGTEVFCIVASVSLSSCPA